MFLLLCISFASTSALARQWMPVNNGLSTLTAPSIVANAETLYASVYGGGVYKSTDLGDNWVSISTNIGTLQVSDIQLAPYVLAGTDSGVYMRVSDGNWGHFPTTGMENTLVRFLTLTPESPDPRLNVGTPGGIFRQLHTSDWESANNGLVGPALDVRSLTAYESSTVDYGMAGTADGIYMTFDNYATWQKKSNGLSGSSLRINKALNLGSSAAVAETDSGLFVTTDLGENWITVIPTELFTTGGIGTYPGTGLAIYFFGVKGFATTNFSTWIDIGMEGVTGGHVLDFATTSAYIYVSTQTGGIFRKALTDLTSAGIEPAGQFRGFNLAQNYPNPFNPATRISYSVLREGFVSLVIYDMLGREVATLVQERQEPGEYFTTWNADGVPSGVYFYRLAAGEYVSTQKMVLMR